MSDSIRLPTGLSPDIIQICSNLENDETILEEISKDPFHLTQFFWSVVSDDKWIKKHIQLSQKIIVTLEALCKKSNNAEFKQQIVEICYLLVSKFEKKDKSFDKFAILKIALATKSEKICDRCFVELFRSYRKKINITLQFSQINYQQIAIGFRDLDFRVIQKTLALFEENKFEPVLWMVPDCKNTDKLKQFLEIFGNKVYHLELSDVKEQNSSDIIEQVAQLCPNLNKLIVIRSSVSNISLNNLNKLSSLFISHCDNLKNLKLNSLKTLEIINVNSCEEMETIQLESLDNLSLLSMSSCKKLKNFTLDSTEGRISISGFGQLEELPDFSAFTELSEVSISHCQMIEDFRWIRKDSDTPDTYVKWHKVENVTIPIEGSEETEELQGVVDKISFHLSKLVPLLRQVENASTRLKEEEKVKFRKMFDEMLDLSNYQS